MNDKFEDKVNNNSQERVDEFDYRKKGYFQDRPGEFDYRNKNYFQETVGEFDYSKKEYNKLTPETQQIAPDAKPPQAESTAARNRDAITKFALGVMATNILNKIK